MKIGEPKLRPSLPKAGSRGVRVLRVAGERRASGKQDAATQVLRLAAHGAARPILRTRIITAYEMTEREQLHHPAGKLQARLAVEHFLARRHAFFGIPLHDRDGPDHGGCERIVRVEFQTTPCLVCGSFEIAVGEQCDCTQYEVHVIAVAVALRRPSRCTARGLGIFGGQCRVAVHRRTEMRLCLHRERHEIVRIVREHHIEETTGFGIARNAKSEHETACAQQQRAGDIVTRAGQPHIYIPLSGPSSGSQRVWPPGPLVEKDARTGTWQMLTPRPEASCGVFGTNDLVGLAGWGGGRVDSAGDYAWNLWRPYQCCSRRGQWFLFDINWIAYPP